MFVRRLALAAVLTAMGATGCSHAPPPGQPIARNELTRMLSGRSLLVEAPSGWPYQTLLYLDRRGTGWRDALVRPGYEPVPGGMSMLISWVVSDPDGLCTWSTPLIGDMPSSLPPTYDCIQIQRAPGPQYGLQVTFRHGRDTYITTAQLLDGNTFPPASLTRYDRQVRALYGGRLPSWTLP